MGRGALATSTDRVSAAEVSGVGWSGPEKVPAAGRHSSVDTIAGGWSGTEGVPIAVGHSLVDAVTGGWFSISPCGGDNP